VAAVTSGLKAGERVVSEGVQRVRPGIVVQAAPATPAPGMSADALPHPGTTAADPPSGGAGSGIAQAATRPATGAKH
jgi:membrane fusion protein (multidrug efflux system)